MADIGISNPALSAQELQNALSAWQPRKKTPRLLARHVLFVMTRGRWGTWKPWIPVLTVTSFIPPTREILPTIRVNVGY